MRAAIVLIEGDAVALIERRREGRRYYLFPGGQVGPGESPEDAAVREASEELGVSVELDRLVARGRFGASEQHYYLARVVRGTFGSGTGDEMRGLVPADAGTYRAVWWPVAALGEIDLRPAELGTLIATVDRTGWPAAAVDVAG
jgi:8-oxo-dGTP pyrophosphatase MutT (NUDIX family)